MSNFIPRNALGQSNQPGRVSNFIYISHANVVQDPAVPVPQWGLSDLGRSRVERMLGQPWISAIGRVVCSAETKSIEAAEILANHVSVDIEIIAETGETDRTSTGYVPHEEHERLASLYFARPHESAGGWERSIDSQARIVKATGDLLNEGGGSDVAVVGHGGVGTLLFCHLAGLDIDERHGQPGQGHYWTYDRAAKRVVHGWRPIDSIE